MPDVPGKRGTSPRTMWFIMSLVMLCGLVMVLLVAEYILRASGYGEIYITDPLFQSSTYPGVVYEFRPGARGYLWGHTRTQISEEGLRGPEITVSKPSGVLRVGVFGDSFTFGLGVEESQTYARNLEGQLEECVDRNHGSVQVLNFGVPSYNITNIVSSFVDKAAPFSLDVAILSPILDDYGFDRNHHADEYGYPVMAGTPLKPGPIKNALRKVRLAYLARNAWVRLIGVGDAERAVLLDPQTDPELAKRTMERAERELRRFKEVGQNRGTAIVYAQLGWRESTDMDRLVERIGLYHVAIKKALEGHSTAELVVSDKDGHPSPLQHRLIASTLKEAICTLLRSRQNSAGTHDGANLR